MCIYENPNDFKELETPSAKLPESGEKVAERTRTKCDDCNGTGFYQPLMREREPCRTCKPTGDVLNGRFDAYTEWARRHPVVGAHPSEHQADCLCETCSENARMRAYLKDGGENPVPREERIQESKGDVVETKYEVRDGKTWKITIYASGYVEEEEQEFLCTRFIRDGSIWQHTAFADGSSQEVDTGVAATIENLRRFGDTFRVDYSLEKVPERSCVGGSQLLKPGEEGMVVLHSPVRGQIRRMFVGAYMVEDGTEVSALVLKSSQADGFPMFPGDFTTDVGIVQVGVAVLTRSPVEVHCRNILNVPVVVHATLEIEKK